MSSAKAAACPQCGHEFWPGITRCEKCGGSLSDTPGPSFCPNRGAPNDENAAFCASCGSPGSDAGYELFLRNETNPSFKSSLRKNNNFGTSLATRSSRLVAKLIDYMLFMGGLIYLQIYGSHGFLYTLIGNPVDNVGWLFFLWAFGIGTVQVVMLTLRGQTIGKRIVGIRIVSNKTGENAGFVRNVVMRAWLNSPHPFWLIYMPVDVLFIFRRDRMCLHDRLAGTRVVK